MQFSHLGTKRVGLEKLREITKKTPNCSLVPFRVITRKHFNSKEFKPGEHFRHPETNEMMPRLLVRSDYKDGEVQSAYDWSDQERAEFLHPNFMSKNERKRHREKVKRDKARALHEVIQRYYFAIPTQEEIERMKIGQGELLERTLEGFKNFVDDSLKAGWHVITHPLRKREDIRFSGQLNVDRDNVTLYIRIPSEEDRTHRDLVEIFFFRLDRKSGKIIGSIDRIKGGPVTPKKQVLENYAMIKKQAEKILTHVQSFLKTADEAGLKGKNYESSFVTYVDEPTNLEFYDLLVEKKGSGKLLGEE